jgi:8-oxo-dGTP pyrophosphatase MutT (NUDIX family)
VHAWLANWDAVGLGGDNLGTIKGVPTALDLGGALEYRAQGAPKGKAFGKDVTELDTLRDAKINKDAAGIFGDMTPSEMRESARYVTRIPDAKIKAAVQQLGGDEQLANKLIARKNDIAERARYFGQEGDPTSKDGTVVIPEGSKLPVKELNGVKFGAWRPPADWGAVDGQDLYDEPEFDPGKKKPSSGVVIREPDGRVWLMQPRGGYGGYEATFPKGGLEKGLSLQANAIKEAYEETGLKVRITGFAGDHEGDTTVTRFYHAVREGGDPSKHEDESEGVVLAPKKKAEQFLNRKRDREYVPGSATCRPGRRRKRRLLGLVAEFNKDGPARTG